MRKQWLKETWWMWLIIDAFKQWSKTEFEERNESRADRVRNLRSAIARVLVDN